MPSISKVVDGRLYDTEKATEICDLGPSGYSRNDWQWEDTCLYRTKGGAFFISGEGGPLSRWARSHGQGGKTGGSGLYVIDEDEAKALVAEHCPAERYVELFGPVPEA